MKITLKKRVVAKHIRMLCSELRTTGLKMDGLEQLILLEAIQDHLQDVIDYQAYLNKKALSESGTEKFVPKAKPRGQKIVQVKLPEWEVVPFDFRFSDPGKPGSEGVGIKKPQAQKNRR